MASGVRSMMFIYAGKNLPSVVANVFDCHTIVSKFTLQSYYYLPSQTNDFGIK